MDTNVFISNLKPDDPYHVEAGIIANKLRRNELKAETSVLALLEISSVTSRLYARMHGMQNAMERKTFVIKALRMFTSLGVNLVHIAGDLPVALGSIKADMPSIFSESMLVGIQVPLRTLDLMHVAAARIAKQNNSELGAFVTGDAELLLLKNELSGLTGLAFFSPREYVQEF